jgi:hypothetical protein
LQLAHVIITGKPMNITVIDVGWMLVAVLPLSSVTIVPSGGLKNHVDPTLMCTKFIFRRRNGNYPQQAYSPKKNETPFGWFQMT